MEILSNGYEFTVQSTKEAQEGDTVKLGIVPNSIHVMKKLRVINEFFGTITSENTVEFCGGEFEFKPTETLEKGDKVKVKIKFTDVNLTDDEKDGTIGGNITQSYYKGSYYEVQVYTDTDEDFYIDTTDEWDMNDRVGIKIDPENITVEKVVETEENEEE